jgi:hypothetical protein
LKIVVDVVALGVSRSGTRSVGRSVLAAGAPGDSSLVCTLGTGYDVLVVDDVEVREPDVVA